MRSKLLEIDSRIVNVHEEFFFFKGGLIRPLLLNQLASILKGNLVSVTTKLWSTSCRTEPISPAPTCGEILLEASSVIHDASRNLVDILRGCVFITAFGYGSDFVYRDIFP